MKWIQLSETHWAATGREGVAWDIHKAGSRFECFVAQWDWPDWTAESLEEAKRICEEVDARPPAEPGKFILEIPFHQSSVAD
jgi:hypothetical protein